MSDPALVARIRSLAAELAATARGEGLPSPDEHAAWAARLHEWQELQRYRALARAPLHGLPVQGTLPGGRFFALVSMDGDRPRFLTTTNQDAAIATGANLVRTTSPYLVDGAGLRLGIWDGARVRSTHQEFGSRIRFTDGTTTLGDHGTHVAGTMIAAGVNPQAKGMAPAAEMLSHDWTTDYAEMAAVAATRPGDPGRIPLSNHSYSFQGGWAYYNQPSYKWVWFGDVDTPFPTSAHVEKDFGRYTTDSTMVDAVVAAAPYYLPFFAAGNDRNDQPAAGDKWRTTSVTSPNYTYAVATHPQGDGAYKGGYDNLMSTAVSKNGVTVGAVSDADTDPGNPGGTRSIAAAAMASFSSWGPADDGRIKPDLVGNGVDLFSPVATNNTAYDGTYSGTSMATPNVSGSAALLVDLFGERFPGSAMRASMLKALLIHTADDLGTAGPDYAFGWGLMNTLAAAQLIDAHAVASADRRMLEARLTPSKLTESFSYTWDGSSPIRVTLAWTDPAGTEKTGNDNRARALVNDLNLVVTGPGGSTHRPFVMPYVGDWTNANLATAATTGINTVDPVEQVLISTPPQAGIYTVTVSIAGALTGPEQAFSLVVSGAASTAPGLSVSASTPAVASCAIADLSASMGGAGFRLGGTFRLQRGGITIALPGSEVFTDHARTTFSPSGIPPGVWNLQFTNPGGQSVIVPSAVEVPLSIVNQHFETSTAGWTTMTSTNAVPWGTGTTSFASPITSAFGAGTTVPSESTLEGPVFALPVGATCYTLSFRHWYSFESNYDGGILEVSFDGGTNWANAIASGTSFTANGYNSTLNVTNNPIGSTGSALWSGSSGAFVRTEVSLNPATYSGQTVRFRWRLGCDTGTVSTGWIIDDIILRADVSPAWTAFNTWRYNTMGDPFADETVDTDGDGRTRFGEYAFAGDPAVPESAVATVGESAGYLTITFPIRLEATDVTFTVRTGTAPGSWSNAAVYTSNGTTVTRNGATNTVQVSVIYDGVRAIVTERSATTIASEPSRFLSVIAAPTSP